MINIEEKKKNHKTTKYTVSLWSNSHSARNWLDFESASVFIYQNRARWFLGEANYFILIKDYEDKHLKNMD